MTESVLVTGSSGFIGTALTERLLDEGYRVIGVDQRHNPWSEQINERTEQLNLLTDDLSRIDGSFDVLVHLAANSRVGSAVQNPGEATENGQITRTVLEFARTRNIEHVLFASSREVYGLGQQVVYEESDASPQYCANPYGAGKLFGEALCEAYRNCYNIQTSALRFTNVYGRYDHQDRVVPLFIAQAIAGEQLVVYGKEKVLDFVYLDDCVNAVKRAVKRKSQIGGEAINIGSGVGTTLVDLAEQISERIDQCPGYEVRSEQTGEPTRTIADIDKAKALLEYEPVYDFNKGLNATIEWYRDHPRIAESLI